MLRCAVLPLLVALLHCRSVQSEPLLFVSEDGRQDNKPWLNPSLSEVVPSRVSSGSPRQLDLPDSALFSAPDSILFPEVPMFPEYVNLKWVRFNGSLPNGAVGIFNGYAERTDYVCKVNCESGFYSEGQGSVCHYPYADKEYTSSKFDVLVNVDHFEFLMWTEDSYGSVPQYSVRTCQNVDIFVGKNKYGLGKVVSQHEAFFLPWEGEEYWYKSYQVLSINHGAYTQHVSHVQYDIDHMKLFHHPPEALQLAKVTNLECNSVQKTVMLEKSTTLEKRWDIGRETRNGTVSSMKAQVPILGPGNVDFTKEQTVRFSEGTTMSETISHTVQVQILVPPNHSCSVRMEGRRMTADIPFKARLSRTNRDGETRWTSVIGTYDGVNVGEINAVVERCQPLPDAPPCAPEY